MFLQQFTWVAYFTIVFMKEFPNTIFRLYIEAVVWRCSVKKVFLEISQNLQEKTCAWVF